MQVAAKKLITTLVALSSFCSVGAFAGAPDVEMKLSATTLELGQALTVTISANSKVYCIIRMRVVGLDGNSYDDIRAWDDKFDPPKQYTFKFSKEGKYRVVADPGQNYCGNMANTFIAKDIVVKPLVIAPSVDNAGLTMGATKRPVAPADVTPPATPKPKAKPCKKPGKPGVGEDCDVN